MPADLSPANFFGTGYSAAADAISLNTSNNVDPLLTELTNAEADETTGDWRKVVFSHMECFVSKFDALSEADTPTKTTLQKSQYVDSATGEIVNVYKVTVRTSAGSIEVSNEP